MTALTDVQVVRVVSGRRLIALCAPPQEAMARDVLSMFEQISGGTPRPGLRMQFGWSRLTLQEDADGTLIVCEPDFDGDPFRDVRRRIDTTLRVVAEQTALVKRVHLAPDDVRFDQLVVVARGALAAPRVHLYRSDASRADDSGWTLTAETSSTSSDDPGDFESLHVYEFLSVRPALLPALGLPSLSMVVVEDDRIASVFGPDGRERPVPTVRP